MVDERGGATLIKVAPRLGEGKHVRDGIGSNVSHDQKRGPMSSQGVVSGLPNVGLRLVEPHEGVPRFLSGGLYLPPVLKHCQNYITQQ